MNKYKLRFKPYGSIAILIEWPKEINRDILKNRILFKRKIKSEMADYILDTVPAYNSLTVFFDTAKIKYSGVVKKAKEIYEMKYKDLKLPYKLWKIPVCYDETFGIDLDKMAKSKNMSKEEIIQLHSSAIYDVHFIGFLPGFLYLGGLPEEIHSDRKAKPRQKVEKGAVGIAGAQTGVYPRESPGGWNIIGNSPLDFFDLDQDRPCFASAGDRLQFVSVSKAEYEKIKKEVKSGTYIIESKNYGQ
jgi:inhibitor of KinA